MNKSRKGQQNDQKSQQVHESDTYCPSIERALFKECKLEELLVESQLKKAGIQTAEALIHVLYEEIRSLRLQKEGLEGQIAKMLRQFTHKEENLKMQISFLQTHLQEVKQMKQANSRSSLSKYFLPNSSRKFPAPKSIEKKIHESPIRKMSLVETISKEYVEYEFERGAMIFQQAVSVLLSKDMEGIIVDFGEMNELLREQKIELQQFVEKYKENQDLVKQLNQELQMPQSPSPKYQSRTKAMSRYQSGQKSVQKKYAIKGKKLFSTENSNDTSPDRIKFFSLWQDRIKQQIKGENITLRSVMKDYEDIIQGYKEYSAYLKAYLCSCIAFISKQTEEITKDRRYPQKDQSKLKHSSQSESLSTNRSNDLVDFPSNRLFDVLIREILSTVEEKIEMEHEIRKELQQENKQLREILDQLVDNLKKSGIQGRNRNNGTLKSKDNRVQGKPQINRVKMTEMKWYKNYQNE